jgi:hypothetical protein
MLRADHFRKRERGADAFWKLVEFLIQERQDNLSSRQPDEERQRRTWYLDTPGTELRNRGYALRVREKLDGAGQSDGFKVTLKFRSADRYVAAGKDMRCTEKVKKDDDKFEEDILPPFSSKFARSVSFKSDEEPDLSRMDKVTAIFPGLSDLGILPETPVDVVNGFRAYEISHRIGQLRFVHMAPMARAARAAAEPEFLVKCCLNFWYLQEGDEWPLAAEFSFDFDLPERLRGDGDQLEHFEPKVVAGTNVFFRSLQKQAGWMDQSGTTKTAYAFEAL